MRESGKVREVNGNHVVITITEHRASSCNQCSLHGHCHRENGERILTLWTKDQWQVGDEVWVEIREEVLIEIATLLFFVPTLLLIGGSALLSHWLPQLWSVVAALGMVGGYFCLLRGLTPKIMRRVRILPKESVAEVYDEVSHYTRYPENIGV
ncbi:MAG: SoxR reducing system RseC family protein [Brevinematales bacterium]|nr:SoxR reducing system RseC family protein [Brevinematales bacterium]